MELETTIENLIRSHLGSAGTVLEIVPDCAAGEIQSIGNKLADITASKRTEDVLALAADWCLRHDLPSDWQAQRDLIAAL